MASPHAPPLLAPVRIEQNHGGEPLGELLARGEIDALIGSRKPESFGRHPDVARLFPDYRALERELYETTGIFPIMHLIAIPARSLRAPPLARDQLLQGIHRIQAAGARAHALCGLARLHAAVAPGRDRGDRHGVRRRCLAVRDRAPIGRPCRRWSNTWPSSTSSRRADPDRGSVRPAAGRAGELNNAGSGAAYRAPSSRFARKFNHLSSKSRRIRLTVRKACGQCFYVAGGTGGIHAPQVNESPQENAPCWYPPRPYRSPWM